MLTKLNLGCGIDKKKDYINCDISKEVNPDKILNLEKKFPFKDNSFDEIIANHVFEHVKNFVPMMKEIHRICKKGAKIFIRVPFYNSCEQATDPTHVRAFSPFSFKYFDRNSNLSQYSHEVAGKTLFSVNSVKLTYGLGRIKFLNFLLNPLINFNHSFYCKFLSGILPASEIFFEIEVIK